ncbi:MAG: hypothetical protein NTU63_03635 [Candidatus Pacearchaeota archaeon]|nr:hypothetical protein [Candidatus Pacearchaeota archaeon]
MSFHPYTSYTPESSQKHLEIERKRQEFLEERTGYLVRRTKNPPSLKNISRKVSEMDLIAAVHEELVLRQMQKAFDVHNSKSFWKNQKRFLEFIDLDTFAVSEKASLGYKYGHEWFLNNSRCFALRFLDITSGQLEEYKIKNRETYNELCTEMNQIDKKYCVHCFTDLVLMPIPSK